MGQRVRMRLDRDKWPDETARSYLPGKWEGRIILMPCLERFFESITKA